MEKKKKKKASKTVRTPEKALAKRVGVNTLHSKKTARKVEETVSGGKRKGFEYSNIFRNEDGIEVEFRIKSEHPVIKETREVLSFLALSSYRFHLEAADAIVLAKFHSGETGE